MPSRYIPGSADAKREFARVADALNKPIVHDWGTIASDQVLDVQVADANTMVLAGDVDLTLKTDSVPDRTTVRLFIKQDGTGGRLVTSWTGVTWLTGSAPILRTAADAIDILEFTFLRFGSAGVGEWIGVHVNHSPLVIGEDPGGSELLRVGGSVRVHIGVAVGAPLLRVDGPVNADVVAAFTNTDAAAGYGVAIAGGVAGVDGPYQLAIFDAISSGACFSVNPAYTSIANKLRLFSAPAPSSASDTGAIGEIRWDSSFVYVCVATNTWKRAAIATW
jgi:hypothetical protein